MSNYKSGYRSEKLAEKFLEDNGYYVVRSAGSHKVDLSAHYRGYVVSPLLVEVKSTRANRLPSYNKVREKLRQLAKEVPGALVMLAIHWIKHGWIWLTITDWGEDIYVKHWSTVPEEDIPWLEDVNDRETGTD